MAGHGEMSSGQWMAYLRSFIFAERPPRFLPQEDVRGMAALAELLDSHGKGGLNPVSDLQAQQFKSKEMKLKCRPELSE